MRNTYSPEQFCFLKLARRVFRICSILHRAGLTDNELRNHDDSALSCTGVVLMENSGKASLAAQKVWYIPRLERLGRIKDVAGGGFGGTQGSNKT